tara:strand:+ start:1823 stop:2269 length:447 start_codon:yes stop_codon:yes gene_type:complete
MNSLDKFNELEESLREDKSRMIAQDSSNGVHYSLSYDYLAEEFDNPAKEKVDNAKSRKETPVFSGVLKYFPDAIKEVSKCSFAGQQQHNPDKPLAWDRSKSGDEYDALTRHLIDSTKEEYDSDGVLHLAKVAWRALAGLQKHLENNNK